MCHSFGTQQRLLSPCVFTSPCVLFVAHDKAFIRRVPVDLLTAKEEAHGELSVSGSEQRGSIMRREKSSLVDKKNER